MLKHCKKSCKVCSTRPNKEARGGRKRLGEVSNEILDETIHRDEDENVAVGKMPLQLSSRWKRGFCKITCVKLPQEVSIAIDDCCCSG